MKKTPLYEMHCSLGGKIVEFAGWALPVQYTGILEEHAAVRNVAGLFDVSHMGEIFVKGPDAEKFIQKIITNDISGAREFQVVYSPMCYPDGGVVDDLLVYKYTGENYLLVVNASNSDKDFQWLQDNLEGQVEISNISDQYAQLALQGPLAETVLQKLTDFPLNEIKFFHFRDGIELAGINALISRTGYTGEDGFEIYIQAKDAPFIWEKLLEVGKPDGLVPVGLGARDTLRFEAVLPLYGLEISESISPLEAGLGKFVKLGKDDFIGRDALFKQKEQGVQRRLVGFEMIDRGIPRSHYEVQVDGRDIGFVTTGSFAPTLKKNVGLALVPVEYSSDGTEFMVVIRGNPLKARVVKIPFYMKKYKKEAIS